MKPIYNWLSICPLVGGMTIAARAVTGQDPKVLLSFKAFADNDLALRKYLPAVPYEVLDDGGSMTAGQDADFITALCPCAGLSALGTGNQEKKAAANYWMFETAKHVLGTLKPKVFWGENAPAMFSATNEAAVQVREQLLEIAKQHGYTATFYFTSTHLHGIPQRRHRTFYFFWREKDQVPVLKYWLEPSPSWAEYLTQVPNDATHHLDDLPRAYKSLRVNRFSQWVEHLHGPTWPDAIRARMKALGKAAMTVQEYILEDAQNPQHASEMLEWFTVNGDVKGAAHLTKMINKLKVGNIWDGSPSIFAVEGNFNALIGTNMDAAHPTEARSITIREGMHLMGLPHDFNLTSKNYNVICQNVPVCTASDMQRSVLAYLEGELPMVNANVAFQDNFKQTFEVRTPTSNSKLLIF